MKEEINKTKKEREAIGGDNGKEMRKKENSAMEKKE